MYLFDMSQNNGLNKISTMMLEVSLLQSISRNNETKASIKLKVASPPLSAKLSATELSTL